MKPTKKYRVAYEFHGGGKIIVESISMEKAGEKAREILKEILPQLRPEAAKVYKSDVQIIPTESTEGHTRNIISIADYSSGTYVRSPDEEPLDGTTPTTIN